MELRFEGEVWEWRGPAPFHFVSVPADDVDLVKGAAETVTYGWGMVPVRVVIGKTTFTTSLWPKDGGYALPLKDKVRTAEGISMGGTVAVRMTIEERPRR